MTKAADRRFLSVVPSALALALLAAACVERHEPLATEVAALRVATLPEDPTDAIWRDAPLYRAELLLQDLVEPRLLEPSTASVDVRALTDGTHVAFRLEWRDATRDDMPKAARFSDACAVQLPGATEPDVPDPQMGHAGRPVEITLWRASWQAWTDGRKDEIRSIYPNASIDHYPFEAPSLEPGSPEQQAMEQRYAPARRLGNRMEGPRERSVEDLVAEGPGTLTRAEEQRSLGRGVRTETGWQVMIVRLWPEPLDPGRRSEVAFAVWDGDRGEVGSRKMRTGWVPLAIEGER
ncbi:MAG TPA: ethylbenzene dehydrogenase-related protein [Candidatus Polarisedimenticolaceae bacterium]|nr:ethylbenzene dehydrogenase-related protein [Candidatus Polarisedimenticolaceae bacterium]